ncbi:MAG: low affinity iron permease family protein [Candidatus Obscuribacterales bacterium]|nr:low affinity iron permease family protein [Steroidobacteraceae bacterium]
MPRRKHSRTRTNTIATHAVAAQSVPTPTQESLPHSSGIFHTISTKIADVIGSFWAFIAAVAIVIAWGLSGPAAGFSDTWQLIINTGTTIITFLMVFLIQNTQNRDTKAIHLKLDELIRAVEGARTGMVNLESLSDEEIDKIKKEFEALPQRVTPLRDSASNTGQNPRGT